MTLSALMYLIATVLFILTVFEVTIGSVALIPLGLAFVAAGLLFGATPWNRNVG